MKTATATNKKDIDGILVIIVSNTKKMRQIFIKQQYTCLAAHEVDGKKLLFPAVILNENFKIINPENLGQVRG